MRLVFWQNIFSQIDLPYIVGAAKDDRVDEVVIVAEEISKERLAMGWTSDIPGIELCKVYFSPDHKIMEEIIAKDTADSVHIFTGIDAFENVHKAFELSLKYDVKRAVKSERPFTYGFGVDWAKPLWLHRIKYRIKYRKYFSKIDYVFEIGENTSHFFSSVTKKWKVFPFAYCTIDNNEKRTQDDDNQKLQVAFVGGLSKRKSVITLLKAAKQLKLMGCDQDVQFNIIGNGEEKFRLEQYVKDNKLPNVNFLGTMSNKDIPLYLVNQDVFVLPSTHDGWGAVINEAMLAGLYILCSDRCGAKELLDNNKRGRAFQLANYKQLASYLKDCIGNIKKLRTEQNDRRNWAKQNISGDVVAKYMIDCLNAKKTQAPWLKRILHNSMR